MKFALHIVVDGHGVHGLHRFSLEAASLQDALEAVCAWADEGGYEFRAERFASQTKVYPVDLGYWLLQRERAAGDAGRAA